LWDVVSGRELVMITGHAGPVNAVAFSPDGRLASVSSDRTLRLWDAARGRPTATLTGHSGPVNAVAFSPNGRLASASSDGTVRLWDPANYAPISQFKPREGSEAATALGWGPTDLAVAVASSVMLLRGQARGADAAFERR
jgi:WD40 repeat protein